MADTGRYTVVVEGRTFVVEPIHERNQRGTDVAFTNGGISGEGVKGGAARGGSVPAEESIITPENGFTNIVTLPPGVSPMDGINAILRGES